ncbi:MAG: hypothetical protein BJ554DRAFT_2111, partial [Olpidium bornovanus]
MIVQRGSGGGRGGTRGGAAGGLVEDVAGGTAHGDGGLPDGRFPPGRRGGAAGVGRAAPRERTFVAAGAGGALVGGGGAVGGVFREVDMAAVDGDVLGPAEALDEGRQVPVGGVGRAAGGGGAGDDLGVGNHVVLRLLRAGLDGAGRVVPAGFDGGGDFPERGRGSVGGGGGGGAEGGKRDGDGDGGGDGGDEAGVGFGVGRGVDGGHQVDGGGVTLVGLG